MSNTLVNQQVSDNGKYRISVYYDETPSCPCQDWDMGISFLFPYGDSKRLHKCCNWNEILNDNNHTMEEALRELVYKYVPQDKVVKYIKSNKVDNWRLYYDKSDHMWYLQTLWLGDWINHQDFMPSELNGEDFTYELTEFMEQDDLVALLQECGQDIVVKEFVLSGYCQGDYIEGVAYTTKEKYERNCNKDTTDWKKQVNDIIDSNIECVDRWMWGDVYGYVLEERKNFTKTYEDGEEIEDCEWEEIDSCWGFFCEPDEVIKDNLPNAA